MTLIRAALILLVVMVLAACATNPPSTKPVFEPAPEPRTQPDEADRQADQTRQPAPVVRPTGPQDHARTESGERAQTDRSPRPRFPRTAAQASGKAAMALLRHGEQLASSGLYKQASASIERALNIEPRNPFLYQRLAELRLQQGLPQQAVALARKSNSLARNNPYLRAENWALISHALQIQSQFDRADSAARKAKRLRKRIQ